MNTSFLVKNSGLKLAYVFTPATGKGKTFPAVVFMGGFKSDMTGTKAAFFEEKCREQGQAFLRFDYTGHGASQGAFEDGTIGSWTGDAQEMLEKIVHGDVILIGSSMGGWIALNLLLKNPARVKGVIGIAAAPDFTQTIEPRMTEAQKQEMKENGRILVPSSYGPEPYIYTKDLIEDGRKHALLDRKHSISVPLVLLQGKKDDAVPWKTALKIKKCFDGPNTEIIFIDEGDHRLSRAEELEILWNSLQKLL